MGYLPPAPPQFSHNPFAPQDAQPTRQLKALTCPQCRAPLLNSQECAYCGSVFEVVPVRNFTHTIQVNGSHRPGIASAEFEKALRGKRFVEITEVVKGVCRQRMEEV